jgi:hypothetical protein
VHRTDCPRAKCAQQAEPRQRFPIAIFTEATQYLCGTQKKCQWREKSLSH